MNKLRTLLLFIALIVQSAAFSQKQVDTIFNNDEENRSQMGSDLDSMLNLFYVKNSIKMDTSKRAYSEDLKLDLPDSIYIQRLKKIPSDVPLVYNDIVKKYIEWYIRRGKYSIPLIIGMSEYYFPMFEEILDANQMPLEIKYLSIIESALNPRIVSRAGAVGLWQFLYGTGKMYNLEINTFVDERRDPAKSTQAAARFLKDLYGIYGDWSLALAAYNCGAGNVNRAIYRAKAKTGNIDSKAKPNYWDIYQYLPGETRAYMPAFIAAAYVFNYYKEHNLVPVKVQMPTRTDTVMINKQLHLQQVADVLKVSIDELRDLNPQYRKDIIPGLCGSYTLRLPFEYSMKFFKMKDSIFKYKDSTYMNPQKLIKPPDIKESKYAAYTDFNENYIPPSTAGKTALEYTIKGGDTYGFIANWYDVKIADIKYWNNSFSNLLSVGQTLTVYVPTKKLRSYEKINTMTFEEKQKMLSDKIVTTSKVKSNVQLDANFIYYTIQPGDNISTIVKKYPGLTDNDIMNINGFTAQDVRRLQIGQIIKIKKK